MANKLRNDIHNFILNWNKKFPIDFWWRNKYHIPFNSEQHRNTSFIDMFIDFEEEKLMNNLYAKKSEEDKEFDTIGNKMSQEEIDDDFDNIDITKYNTKKDDK